MSAPKVVVVEDDALLRESLAGALTRAGCAVAGGASDADAGCAVVAAMQPDVVICDLRMPHRDEGIALASTVRAEHPRTGVLVVSQDVDGAVAARVLGAAATGVGYAAKETLARRSSLADLVARTARLETVVDAAVARALVAAWRTGAASPGLDDRQDDLLHALVEGRTAAGPEAAAVLRALGVDPPDDPHARTRAAIARLLAG